MVKMTSTFKPLNLPAVETQQEEFMTCRIYRAIRKGDFLRVLAAIKKGDNVHLVDNKNWTTFLHLVVIMSSSSTEDRFLPMIYILSNSGLNINRQDKRGRTALELAINKELKHLMVALMRVGTDLTEKDYKAIIQSMQSPYQSELLDTYEKYEPGLWGALKKNNAGLVHMLVNSWCRINTANNSKTLLQYAKLTRKSSEIIELLEDYDATLEFVHATLAGDEKRMTHFLSDPRGTDPQIMDISHQEGWDEPLIPRSLRDTAIAMGHTHILHLIPDEPTYSSDNDLDYDTGITDHNLDDEDEANDIPDEEDTTPTNSEYSGSIANSLESSLSITPNIRNLCMDKSDLGTATSPYDHNFYYYKSFDEGEQEMYHPDHMIHMASLSAREYRMNWDYPQSKSKRSQIPKPKYSKKKKRSSRKLLRDMENAKSKMCVIS